MITPMRVFVLLFINDRTKDEGIHTVRVGDRNQIMMFESEDDATRYALMLEAQDFFTPKVEAIDSEEVKQFCQSAGYDWTIVPKESDLVLPPEINLEETDWERDSKKDDTDGDASHPQPESQEERELSDPELDRIRRKLEGLL